MWRTSHVPPLFDLYLIYPLGSQSAKKRHLPYAPRAPKSARYKETNKQTHTHTETDKERKKQTKKETKKETNKHTRWKLKGRALRWPNKKKSNKSESAHRHTDSQKDSSDSMTSTADTGGNYNKHSFWNTFRRIQQHFLKISNMAGSENYICQGICLHKLIIKTLIYLEAYESDKRLPYATVNPHPCTWQINLPTKEILRNISEKNSSWICM